jgi:DNA polymerase
MDVKSLLRDLEAALARVEESGARHLSIAPAPLPDSLERPASASDSAGPPGGPDHPASEEPAPADRLPAGVAAPGAAASTLPSAPGSSRPRPPSELSTIEALKFEFRDCLACKLGTTRKRLVFGVGHSRPKLLFIGEGPGAEEDEQGLPFVGRAGALLTGFIRALGLTRDDVYITNVVKCRPPGNRTPEPDEVAGCRPILLRQIELLDPALIVTLGNVPLKALNPAAGGITKERGHPFRLERWDVMPTFHPSYLLRSAAGIPACWQDFRKAFQLAYPDSRIDSGRSDR